jgi:hypothetical protein
VVDVAAALAGARDILAERISDDAQARAKLRELFWSKAVVKSKVAFEKEEAAAKFKDYFNWSEPVAKIPSHRMLAIRRGESERLLMVRINPPEEDPSALIEPLFVTGHGPAAEQVRLAAQDSYKRLLGQAIEVEIRIESKKRADAKAIRVFSETVELACSTRTHGYSLGDFSGGAAAFQIGDAVGLFGNRPFCIFERLSNCGLVGCQFGLGTGNPLLAEAIIHAVGNLEWGAIGQITVCPFNEFAERENLDSTPSDCPRQRDGVVAAIQYDYHNLYLTGGAVLVTEYDGGCAVINGRAQ